MHLTHLQSWLLRFSQNWLLKFSVSVASTVSHDVLSRLGQRPCFILSYRDVLCFADLSPEPTISPRTQSLLQRQNMNISYNPKLLIFLTPSELNYVVRLKTETCPRLKSLCVSACRTHFSQQLPQDHTGRLPESLACSLPFCNISVQYLQDHFIPS